MLVHHALIILMFVEQLVLAMVCFAQVGNCVERSTDGQLRSPAVRTPCYVGMIDVCSRCVCVGIVLFVCGCPFRCTFAPQSLDV